MTALKRNDPRHGSRYAYVNLKCRCRRCTAANTEYKRVADYDRKQRLLKDPSLAPHGSASTYNNWGCRCVPCTKANTEYCRPYMVAYLKRQKALKRKRVRP